MLDLNKIREQFPVLHQQLHGNPLVYLDNAASSQKPFSVIQSISRYYENQHSNVHRGVHTLSQLATDSFEQTRSKVQKWLHAAHEEEIIFTSGTTEAINLVSYSIQNQIQKGDEIIISHLEHHSNIVPWQMLCQRKEAILKVIPMLENGTLDMEAYGNLLNDKTKIVAVNHISNALGIINPVKEIISKAHEAGALVLIDGAQSVPHMTIDVQDLDADFYAFSGHKMYGPTGIGVLYGKKEILQDMEPFQGGGEMIKEVTFEKTTYADIPFKFEAGTPNIADTIAFKQAIEFIESFGPGEIANHEMALLNYTTDNLQDLGGVTIYGARDQKAGAISFNIDGLHPFDVGSILDKKGIAVRTGHHCAQPVMKFYNISGTIRVSFAIYNTFEEVDRLMEGLKLAKSMLI